MSSSDASVVILASVDVALVSALLAALLFARAGRKAVLPIVVAAIVGFVAALAIGEFGTRPPEPHPTDLEPRLSKVEQKVTNLAMSTASISQTAARLADSVGQLETREADLANLVSSVIKLNNLKTKPDAPPLPPPSAKIVIASATATQSRVYVQLKNQGTERASITGADLSFCPAGLPIEPGQKNCTRAPPNNCEVRTFVCPEDGMAIDAGQVSMPKFATITYPKAGQFRVFVKLFCGDSDGRDCGTELTTDTLQQPATNRAVGRPGSRVPNKSLNRAPGGPRPGRARITKSG
jgi:hypothetical protein